MLISFSTAMFMNAAVIMSAYILDHKKNNQGHLLKKNCRQRVCETRSECFKFFVLRFVCCPLFFTSD